MRSCFKFEKVYWYNEKPEKQNKCRFLHLSNCRAEIHLPISYDELECP